MAPIIFKDVVAYVTSSDTLNSKTAIQERLQKHGAKIAQRLTKDVTHIVFERRRSQKAEDAENDASTIASLYQRVEKFDFPADIVTPLWVEQSIADGARCMERKFKIAAPKTNLITAKVGSSSGNKRPRRGPAAQAAPRPADDLDLDILDPFFSSSQQIKCGEDDKGDEGVVNSPKRAGLGGRTGSARLRGRRNAATTTAVAARGLPPAPSASVRFGTETQAVAEILAMELGGGDENQDDIEEEDEEQLLVMETKYNTKKGKKTTIISSQDSEDDLDTPLDIRVARRSLPGSSGAVKAVANKQQNAGRSRLARASGPGAAAASSEPEKNDEASEKGGSKKPAAQRFSVRVLQHHPERPVLLNKGTPLPDAMPKTTVQKKKHRKSIPIPGIERVDSPWQAAAEAPPTEGPPTTQPSQTAAKAKVIATPWTAAGPARNAPLPSPWSAVRPWDKQPQQKRRAGVPSRLGISQDMVQPTPPSQAGISQDENINRQGNVVQDDGDVGGQKKRQKVVSIEEEDEEEQKEESFVEDSDMEHEAMEEDDDGVAESEEDDEEAQFVQEGPTSGVIALTSVASSVNDLARAAVRRLRGLRMCSEGREETATHLIIGDERRTLKVLLAVAGGAFLVHPEWITASLEAGRWLPECNFPAKVRFVKGADRARSLLEDPDYDLPLHDAAVHIHTGKNKGASASATALKKLVGVLGGQVSALKTCDVCVLAGKDNGSASIPSGVPKGAKVVKEEWLFQAAETFDKPDFKSYIVKK